MSHDYDNFCREKLTLLQLMKVVSQHQPKLRYFTPYFYKNILFQLDKNNPNLNWHKDHLAERYAVYIERTVQTLCYVRKDFVKLLYCPIIIA